MAMPLTPPAASGTSLGNKACRDGCRVLYTRDPRLFELVLRVRSHAGPRQFPIVELTRAA